MLTLEFGETVNVQERIDVVVVLGGTLDDVVVGGTLDDVVVGGTVDDVVVGGTLDDVVVPGTVDDVVVPPVDVVVVVVPPGTDVVVPGADVVVDEDRTEVVGGVLDAPGLTCAVRGDEPPHVSSCAPGVQFI